MKRCPECRRDYYDDTLLFCLEDGVALIQGSVPSPDEPPTAVMHETAPPSETATKAQIHTTEAASGLPSGIADVPPSKFFNKGFLLAPMVLAIILVGVFFGYRYVIQPKQIESIAVMPFVNETGDVNVDYLSDGMAETLIRSLSQLPNLSVKARSLVFRYKGQDTDAKTLLIRRREAANPSGVGSPVAAFYAVLGEKEKALQTLENVAEHKGDFWLFLIKIDPIFDPLRADPRFQALVKKFDPPAKVLVAT